MWIEVLIFCWKHINLPTREILGIRGVKGEWSLGLSWFNSACMRAANGYSSFREPFTALWGNFSLFWIRFAFFANYLMIAIHLCTSCIFLLQYQRSYASWPKAAAKEPFQKLLTHREVYILQVSYIYIFNMYIYIYILYIYIYMYIRMNIITKIFTIHIYTHINIYIHIRTLHLKSAIFGATNRICIALAGPKPSISKSRIYTVFVRMHISGIPTCQTRQLYRNRSPLCACLPK